MNEKSLKIVSRIKVNPSIYKSSKTVTILWNSLACHKRQDKRKMSYEAFIKKKKKKNWHKKDARQIMWRHEFWNLIRMALNLPWMESKKSVITFVGLLFVKKIMSPFSHGKILMNFFLNKDSTYDNFFKFVIINQKLFLYTWTLVT